MTTHKPYQSEVAHKFMEHLGEPIDAYTLAQRAGSTFTGTESALRAMQRKGLVRKIVRRKGGEFLAHFWVMA